MPEEDQKAKDCIIGNYKDLGDGLYQNSLDVNAKTPDLHLEMHKPSGMGKLMGGMGGASTSSTPGLVFNAEELYQELIRAMNPTLQEIVGFVCCVNIQSVCNNVGGRSKANITSSVVPFMGFS
ncbi:hypothetical protein ACHQM5_005308 [Ranunculus cassubicifolius]